MSTAAQQLRESADALARLGSCSTDFDALSDDQIFEAERLLSEHRRATDVYSAWLAGQVAHRSRRELGYTGLAARSGFASPEALIQSVSGSTRAEAGKFVRVGTMLAEVAAVSLDPDADAGPSWLAPVALAVASGGLSADAAESIRRGLGSPNSAVTGAQLLEAADALAASGLNADDLFKRARHLRDNLDVGGVALREAELHAQRFLRIRRNPDGTVDGRFRYGPEDGIDVIAAVDAYTSPRRGGPRFTDPVKKAAAEALVADPRTNDQLAADALMGMIRLASDANPATMLGGRPSLRVIVTDNVLVSREGFGRIAGYNDAMSLPTIDRLACNSGILGIKFDAEGRGINIGRDQRLFTERQRAIMAVRDGGCRWPGCDRPPSWTEAHHINQWARDRGCTDVDDGILLCRMHHMLLHNNHWQVVRDGGTYWLRPPRAIDPQQQLIEMPSRTPEIAALAHRPPSRSYDDALAGQS